MEDVNTIIENKLIIPIYKLILLYHIPYLIFLLFIDSSPDDSVLSYHLLDDIDSYIENTYSIDDQETIEQALQSLRSMLENLVLYNREQVLTYLRLFYQV